MDKDTKVGDDELETWRVSYMKYDEAVGVDFESKETMTVTKTRINIFEEIHYGYQTWLLLQLPTRTFVMILE